MESKDFVPKKEPEKAVSRTKATKKIENAHKKIESAHYGKSCFDIMKALKNCQAADMDKAVCRQKKRRKYINEKEIACSVTYRRHGNVACRLRQ